MLEICPLFFFHVGTQRFPGARKLRGIPRRPGAGTNGNIDEDIGDFFMEKYYIYISYEYNMWVCLKMADLP
jgi:hypothetical protein